MKWQRHESAYVLRDATHTPVAFVVFDGKAYVAKVKNRSGGWNYDTSPRVVGAMAKARRMIREEQK